MKLNRATIITVIVTLGLGLLLGAVFFGGSEKTGTEEEHEHDLTEVNGVWTCSMHPQVRQPGPGACPFCGMDLIPLTTDGGGDPTILKMSNAAIQLANIQTTVISTGVTESGIKLNGKVKVDERRVNTQTTHYSARIEKLFKNYTGEYIRKGAKIASLYSPELLAAQEELIEAKELEASNPTLVEAARNKLHHWKLTTEQIHEIEKTGIPIRNYDLLSDYTGILTRKMVNSGDHLMEGEAIIEVTDLSKIWVVFDVYEKDIEQLRLNDKLRFSSNASNREMDATIAFISPQVNPQTRIVEVRADVDNKDNLLIPEMFVQGTIAAKGISGLTVPKSAVLWTGERSIVYVKLENGSDFQLREVVLGVRTGDHYMVESGLNDGDEVVTNGAFTLDAESQLRGNNSMMNPISVVVNLEDAVFKEVELPEFKDFTNMVTPEFQKQLTALSLEYVKLKDLMVEGDGDKIRKAGIVVEGALKNVDMSLTKGDGHMHWMAMLNPMQESLTAISSTEDRDVQRLQFINLSKALINAVQSFGTSIDSPLYVQFCPMANQNKGAAWISLNEEIINPFYGDAMLNCGNIEDIITNEK